jgi:thiosulfate/3-mercaptopyruvate sulfurtransferase
MAAEINGYGNDGAIVSVDWLMEHRAGPGLVVIDPRPAHEYAAAHLPGAVHLDVYQPELKVHDSSPAERDRFIAAAAQALGNAGVGFDPERDRDGPRQRVVFTEAVSGTLAARGVWILDLLGHGGGAMLDGGLYAWVNAGGELTRAVPDVVPASFTPAPDYDLLPAADEIRAAVAGAGSNPADPGTIAILDTRADMEYASGTIPTSVHLEWTANLDPNGALRPPEELLPLYAEAGLEPDHDRPVVTFCGSGYRAAHSYVVLKALGFPRVSNYAPSWGEWGRRPDLPTEQPDRPYRDPNRP